MNKLLGPIELLSSGCKFSTYIPCFNQTRILSNDEKYSESVFINKLSGEMLHEVTTNINSKKQGKEISFFTCDMS